ncbi:MAG: hypothetical protein AB8G26_03670, partial [Ilumatobacter sp.]
GTLNVGDPIVAGGTWGKVRAMINDKGEQIKSAGPSTPVQVDRKSAVETKRVDLCGRRIIKKKKMSC